MSWKISSELETWIGKFLTEGNGGKAGENGLKTNLEEAENLTKFLPFFMARFYELT